MNIIKVTPIALKKIKDLLILKKKKHYFLVLREEDVMDLIIYLNQLMNQ